MAARLSNLAGFDNDGSPHGRSRCGGDRGIRSRQGHRIGNPSIPGPVCAPGISRASACVVLCRCGRSDRPVVERDVAGTHKSSRSMDLGPTGAGPALFGSDPGRMHLPGRRNGQCCARRITPRIGRAGDAGTFSGSAHGGLGKRTDFLRYGVSAGCGAAAAFWKPAPVSTASVTSHPAGAAGSGVAGNGRSNMDGDRISALLTRSLQTPLFSRSCIYAETDRFALIGLCRTGPYSGWEWLGLGNFSGRIGCRMVYSTRVLPLCLPVWRFTGTAFCGGILAARNRCGSLHKLWTLRKALPGAGDSTFARWKDIETIFLSMRAVR